MSRRQRAYFSNLVSRSGPGGGGKQKRTDANLGLVYRSLNAGGDALFGGSIFYDRNLDQDNQRLGLGFDVQSQLGYASFNYYYPLSNDWRQGRSGFEERVRRGYDFSLEKLFYQGRIDVDVNFGAWRRNQPSKWVYTYGIDLGYKVTNYLSLSLGYEDFSGRPLSGLPASQRWQLGLKLDLMKLYAPKAAQHAGNQSPLDLWRTVTREKRILYQERVADTIISFATSNYNVEAEDAGTVTLTIKANQPLSKDVVLTYSTRDGSATAGSDYEAIKNGSVTITAGDDSSATIEIQIIANTADEAAERFSVDLSLSTATAGVRVNPATVTITIAPSAPTVSSITRATAASSNGTTNSNTVSWLITFSKSVQNIDESDFDLNAGGSSTAATTSSALLQSNGTAGQNVGVSNFALNADDSSNGAEILNMTPRNNDTEALVTARSSNDGPLSLSFHSLHDIADEHDKRLLNTIPTSGINENTFIIDSTGKPVITLNGPATVILEAGSSYTEEGATASDNFDGDISDDIEIDSTSVNTNTVGIYSVTYNVFDSNNNAALTVTRRVSVTDNTGPTVVISGVASVIGSAPFTATITFSEAVSGFEQDDITEVNATLSNFSGSDADYTVDVTAKAAGTLSLSIDAKVAKDAAGNPNTAALAITGSADLTAPRVDSIKRSSSTDASTNADSVTWRITFSEAVENADVSDFNLSGTNATLTVVLNGKVLEVTASDGDLADLEAEITLSFDPDQDIKDAAGNPLSNIIPSGANEKSYTIDNTPPTVMISDVKPNVTAARFSATITFSEVVTDFELNDIMEVNATLSSFRPVSGTVYMVDVKPTADGELRLSIEDGAAWDAAGNKSEDVRVTSMAAVFSIGFEFDNYRVVAGETLSLTVKASRPLIGDEAVDVEWSDDVGGTALSGPDYTLPPASQDRVVRMRAGESTVIIDGITILQNTAGEGDESFTVSLMPAVRSFDVDRQLTTITIEGYDVAPTVVSIQRRTPPELRTNADSVTWRITFNEAVENADASDFILSSMNAPLTNVTLTTVLNGNLLDVTASGGDLVDLDAPITLSFARGQDIQDTVGKTVGNPLANTIPSGSNYNEHTYTIDNTGPTVAISGVAPTVGRAPFTATITFSEAVNGFEQSDIVASNATLATFRRVSDAVYTVEVTATASGELGLSIDADVAEDEVGNANTAAPPITRTVDRSAPTVASIERQTPTNELTNTDRVSWRVTFSEAVRNADVNDFSLNGTTATLAARVESSAVVLTASDGDIADLNSQIRLDFALTYMIEDRAGNPLTNTTPTDANDSTFTFDTTAPEVVSIQRMFPMSAITSVDEVTWSVLFNEEIKNVDASDFILIGGSTAILTVVTRGSKLEVYVGVSGGDISDFTGDVTLGFADTYAIQDEAGNPLTDTTPTGSNENTFTLDNNAPQILSIARILPTEATTNADSVRWGIRFDKRITNVDSSDFIIIAGSTAIPPVVTANGFGIVVTTSGGDLSDFNGDVTLGFADTHDIEDVLGNPLTNTTPSDTNDNTFTLDNRAPEVVSIERQDPTNERTNADSVTWSITFNEAVENVDASDFSLGGANNATLGFVVNGSVLEVTASDGNLADLNAEITLSFITNPTIQDLAGNALTNTTPSGANANDNSYTIDNTAPTVLSIERMFPMSAITSVDEVTWSILFNEEIKNVDASDFSLSGTTATLGLVVNGSVLEVTASDGNLADLNAEIMLSFITNPTIEDAVGNALTNTTPSGTNDNSYTIDNTAPTVVSIERDSRVTPASPNGRTNSDSVSWTITFSEAVENADANDFSLSDTTATLAAVVNGSVLEITASDGDLADLDAEITLSFAAGQDIQNALGNPLSDTIPTGANDNSYTIDNTDPTVVTIDVASDIGLAPVTATITFSEAVTGFEQSDIRVSNNLTLTNFSGGVGSTYTVSVTATADGSFSLELAAGIVEDAAGNLNTVSVLRTGTADVTAPEVVSIERASPTDEVTSIDTVSWRITFNETVMQAGVNDFILSGGGTARLTVRAASGAVRVVTASGGDIADLNGQISLDFASAYTIEDRAGNPLADTTPSSGINDSTFTFDNTAPEVVSIQRTSPTAATTNADSVTWSITFNEAVENVDASDFSLSGTTATLGLVVNGSVLEVTASDGNLADLNAEIMLSFITNPTIEDAVGNALTNTTPSGTNDNSYTIDNTAPTVVSIERDSRVTPASPNGRTNSDSVSWTITFSEAVENADANDFSLSDTTATLAAVVNGSVLEITASDGDLADLDAEITLSFAAGQDIQNALGNPLSDTIPTGANDNSYTIDNTDPTVVIIDVASDIGLAPVIATITFSEAVTGFEQSDITVSNNVTLTNFSGGVGSTYTVSVTATADGSFSLELAAGIVEDAAGNLNTVSVLRTGTADVTAPEVVSIERASPTDEVTSIDTVSWRITFNETVMQAGVNDFILSGGGTARLTVRAASGAVRVVTASGGDIADLNGQISLDFASAYTIEDRAGNPLADTTPSSGINDSTFTFDNTAPEVVSIQRTSPTAATTNADSVTWSITFNEAVENVDASDFSLSGTTATLGFVVNGSVLEVTASDGNLADLNAEIMLSFITNPTIEDAVGNALTNTTPSGTNDNSYTIDNTAPTVVSIERDSRVTPASPNGRTNSDSVSWTITFSEAVENADANDFSLSDTTATLAAVVNGSVLEITASDGDLADLDAEITLSFAAGQDIQNALGNPLSDTIPTGANDNSYTIDNTDPTVVIIDVASDIGLAPVTATITFSEAVTGFEQSDITVSNNVTLTNFSGGVGSTYTVSVTATADGSFSLELAAGIVEDAAGNLNTVSVLRTGTADVTAPEVVSIERASPTDEVTSIDTVSWRITFNETVMQAGVNDFILSGGGTARLTVRAASGAVRVVTASGGDIADLNGQISLDFASAYTIEDRVGNPLADTTPSSGINDSTFTFDNTAPEVVSIQRTSPTAATTNADSVTWSITFNEAVENVDASDFSLSGTTATLGFVVNGSVLEVTASDGNLADLNAEIMLSFITNPTIEDAVGNALTNTTPSGTNDNSYTLDNTPPEVLSATVSEISTGLFRTTITFSEAVTGFTQSGIMKVNATLSNFIGSDTDTVYTVDVTPTPTTTDSVRLSIDAGAAKDLVGNPSLASTVTSFDPTALRVVSITRQNPANKRTNADSVAWRITFSKAVQDADTDDFSLSFFSLDGTPLNNITVNHVAVVLNGSGKKVLEVTASGGDLAGLNAEITLSLLPDHNIQDTAGTRLANTAPGINNNSYIIDNTAPIITISAPPTVGPDTFTATITFSEDVSGFAQSAITPTNATLANFLSVSDTVYTVEVTATGAPTLSIAKDAAQDLAGNSSSLTELTISADFTAPTLVSIERSSPTDVRTNADSVTWSILFDEEIKTPDASDFIISTGGRVIPTLVAVSTFEVDVATRDDGRFEVNITASGGDLSDFNGDVALGFPGTHNIQDAVGNPLTDITLTRSDNGTFVFDNIAPKVRTIYKTPASAITNADSVFWSIFLNEGVKNVDASDFILISDSTATFRVDVVASRPTAIYVTVSGGDLSDFNGDVTLGFANGHDIQDTAGNPLTNITPSSGTNRYTFTLDNIAPEVDSIERASPTDDVTNTDDRVSWHVTFSETVKNISADDFILNGVDGTTITTITANLSIQPPDQITGYRITADISGLTYTGPITLNFKPTHGIQDTAGNALTNITPSSNANENSYTLDNSNPTVVISGVESDIGGATFTATITFSEAVTGFEQSDIRVSNNLTLTKFSGADSTYADSTYTVRVTATADGPFHLSLAARIVKDAAGNHNTALVVRRGTADLTAPEVVSIKRASPTDEITGMDTVSWRIRFNENVMHVGKNDFILSGGGTARLTVRAASGAVRVVTASGGDIADLTGQIRLDFARAYTIEDRVGNPLTDTTPSSGTNDSTFTFDNTPPEVVSIRRVETPITNAYDVSWIVRFNEEVKNISIHDFIFISGSTGLPAVRNISKLEVEVYASGNDISYYNGDIMFAFSGTHDIQDRGGNPLTDIAPSSGINEHTYTLDHSAPEVVSIKREFPTNEFTHSDRVRWRVTFNEAVKDVDVNDFILSGGGTASLTIRAESSASAVRVLTASGRDLADLDGQIRLDFARAYTIEDRAGNPLTDTTPSSAINDNTFTLNNTAPEVVSIRRLEPRSPVAITRFDNATWSILFNEEVKNVDLSDFILSGTSAFITVVTISSKEVHVLATGNDLPNLNGDVTLAFARTHDIQDVFGNPLTNTTPTNINENTVTLDNTPPEVVSIRRGLRPTAALTNADSLRWSVLFSEPIKNLDESDFILSGGSRAILTLVHTGELSTGQYGILVTANGGNLSNFNGDVTLGFANRHGIQDVVGNPLTTTPSGINESTYTLDNVIPTVTVTDLPEDINLTPFEVVIRFSRVVYGLESAGITVSNNATLGAVSGSGTLYMVIVTPTGPGRISVQVAAGAAKDAAGNQNSASREAIGTVADITPPVITLIGLDQFVVTNLSDYLELGAIGIDNADGDISKRIELDRSDVVQNPQTDFFVYTITYDVSDSSGNAAATVTRTIHGAINDLLGGVPDNTPPVITLIGLAPFPVGDISDYFEFGAIATDNVDGNITYNRIVVERSDVTRVTRTLGETVFNFVYTITYSVKDRAGNNAATVTRTIYAVTNDLLGGVPDNTPPVITLIGRAQIGTVSTAFFRDQGATATDNVDGDRDITNRIVVERSDVTRVTRTLGETVFNFVYTITYSVKDRAGNNAATVTRTIYLVTNDL